MAAIMAMAEVNHANYLFLYLKLLTIFKDKALTLDPANVQSNSATTGQETNADPAQADSLTDSANFINFCTGKTITNGLQVKGGSCNGIVMGDIPSATNMVSSIITFPGTGEDIAADTEFDIKVKVLNLVAGSFTSKSLGYKCPNSAP